MKVLSVAAIGLLNVLPTTAEYVWPSQYDELEDILYLQSGYIRRGFRDGVTPCSFSSAGTGRQTAAEWIRTAYHDMSTYDVSTGLGGLDASIVFETERDENVGAAFNGTFGFANSYYSIKASMADLIALSVVVASKSCGGSDIPFRAGRIDATEAGPTGVPKPDQDIETHKLRFATAGFNTSDMIAMVACGHTLGGVHGNDFPEITGNNSASNFEHFENGESFESFDNHVVTEYLDDSTSNPLVKGFNETTNSDKRVFGADGNVTMNMLADPTSFQQTCADILARMIDTVPASVTLSNVITPIEIKPSQLKLQLSANNSLTFSGRIRVRTTDLDADSIESVSLIYADRDGKTSPDNIISTTRPTWKLGQSNGFEDTFTWYEFLTTLPVASSISSFNVSITSTLGSVVIHDNSGHGFPLNDAILYQEPQSCLSQTANADGNWNLTIVAAVRTERASDPVRMDFVNKISRQGVAVKKLEVQSTALTRLEGGEREGYVLFSGSQWIDPWSWDSSVDVVLGEGEGEVAVEFQNTGSLGQDCAVL